MQRNKRVWPTGRKNKLTKPDHSAIAGDRHNTPLSIMGRITRYEMNKDIEQLNNPINQLRLIYVYIY